MKTYEYRQYLFDHLHPYLFDFFKRCKPLFNIERDLGHVKQDFELKWEQGIFPGWPVRFLRFVFHRIESNDISRFSFQKEAGGALAKSGAPLDLTGFSSAEVKREKKMKNVEEFSFFFLLRGIGVSWSRSIEIGTFSSRNEMWRNVTRSSQTFIFNKKQID